MTPRRADAVDAGPGAEPRVLLCDNHVLAVAKPAGWPVVPDSSGDRALLDWAKDWVKREYAKPGDVFLGVVHRLDRPVSGVVVFGRTSKGAERLSRAWREGRVHKEYEAWTEPPAPRSRGAALAVGDEGEIEQWLSKDRDRNLVSVVAPNTPGARHASTRFRVLAPGAAGLHLLLEPVTGRSHQLRVACARGLGAPICGDVKYGAREPMAGRRIALHAARLRFPHPTRDEEVALEWPTPLWS